MSISEEDKRLILQKKRCKKLRDYLESAEDPEKAFNDLVNYLCTIPIEIPQKYKKMKLKFKEKS